MYAENKISGTTNANLVKRSMFAVSCGTALELYDFYLFVHMMIVLKPLFFQGDDLATSSLLTITAFAVSKIARPLGSLVYGHFSDKIGRRSVVMASIAGMIVPTIIMGIIPTYAQIGIAASVIFMLARFIQTFAVGGETATAGTFVVEHAPKGKIGFYGGLIGLAGDIGVCMSSCIGYLCMTYLSPDIGWRVPFFISFGFGLVVIYFRRSLKETPTFLALKKKNAIEKLPLKTMFTKDLKGFFVVIGCGIATMTPLAIAWVYIPDVLSRVYHVSSSEILLQAFKGTLIGAVCRMIFARLADKIGINIIMKVLSLCFVFITYPMIMILKGSEAVENFFYIQYALVLINAPLWSLMWSFIYIQFQPEHRATASGVSWGIVHIISFGVFPVLITLLANKTGNVFLGVIIAIMFGGICGFIASMFAKDLHEFDDFDKEGNLKGSIH
jgi:MFS family permease